MSKSKVHVSPTHLLWFGGLTNSNRTGKRFENQSVAQIVISTATDKSQTLAFNYASLAINNPFFLHHLVRPAFHPPRLSQFTHKPLQKPPISPAQNHETALTDKTLSPGRTQTFGAIIAAQLGSLADQKAYVAAAAQGISGKFFSIQRAFAPVHAFGFLRSTRISAPAVAALVLALGQRRDDIRGGQ